MRHALLALLAVARPVLASPFGDAATVADQELATMRGGVMLPNGMDVSIGIAIETQVDGQLALRTHFSTEGGLQIFTGGAATARPAASAGSAVTPPTVRVERGGVGTVISPTMSLPNVRVAVTQGPATAGPPSGTEVPVAANGATVDTAFGAIRLQQGAGGSVVVLDNPTLELRHLIGAATGIVVANTADNRAIDTVATVSIQLNNAMPALENGALRIDRIAADAGIVRNPL